MIDVLVTLLFGAVTLIAFGLAVPALGRGNFLVGPLGWDVNEMRRDGLRVVFPAVLWIAVALVIGELVRRIAGR